MKRPAILTALALVGALTLAGCSSPATSGQGDGDKPAAQQETQAPEVVDLSGEWAEENPGESTQVATITADTITINWAQSDGTRAIYWVGTVETPGAEGAWTSTRDAEATKSALLASQDDTKAFTFKDGKLSYEVTAMGVTKPVTLVRK